MTYKDIVNDGEQNAYNGGFNDGYNQAIDDVQRWLSSDGWDLVKALRYEIMTYPKEVNIHARLITEIGKLRKHNKGEKK